MRTFLPIAAALVAVAPLAAQSSTTRVVPAEVATTNGSSSSPYFSGYGAGIAQQVIASWGFCKTNALINQVDLRPTLSTTAVPSRSFTNVKFYVGYALTTPDTMSTTFASNRGTVTKYLDAAYTLPAQLANSQPFNIPFKLSSPFVYLANKGDLLLEWEVPGTATKSNYFFDAHVATTSVGGVDVFGTAGGFSVPSSYSVDCPSPSTLVPGGSIVFQADAVPSNNGSLAFLGFSRTNYGPLTLPFDLTPLGAAGNWLNVSIDLTLPLPLSAAKNGYTGSVKLPIPADNTLPGLHVFMQGVFADAKANKFGLVFSQGVDMGLVSGKQVQQLVGTYDAKNTTGSLYSGQGTVVQLSGVFN
ncbi:MAG: hypothetical protein R3F30_08355 [Planctomycetota bacterium]